MPDTTARLREAAYALFEQQGYAATTVDQIAARAGVGRSTFFRAFGSKEDVIFPDHEALVARVAARLETLGSDPGSAPIGATEAARIVLEHYLAEGDLARARYRLTASVPTLRDREVSSTTGYRRLFRDALRTWTGEEPGDDLRAEVIAGSIVTAHNHVLRRWLRGDLDDAGAREALDRALGLVLTSISATASDARSGAALRDGTTVVVMRSGATVEQVLPQIRAALGRERPHEGPSPA
ncbi:TetR/AcrR family transcriptional regulator [uncultured Nocardioides sp.]|uniref:TetR/AcrR family transcriptional regulator n=1 Tax=uncultured Nocardioides sp. TaxID=198441 RepID=UPI00260D09EC|nr:TetR/AcrR family transcriptional regulator [uncultured Nocardioides sp.]